MNTLMPLLRAAGATCFMSERVGADYVVYCRWRGRRVAARGADRADAIASLARTLAPPAASVY